jgi:uncharacterized protein (DUF1810 family)
MSLKRFHDAQNSSSGYNTAVREIKAGRKTSHWIWYIFPQLKELGVSANAKFYGISDLDEACKYLQDPVLFKHYDHMVELVEQQLSHVSLNNLMGGAVDARKFTSSITLFRGAAAYLNTTGQDKHQDFKKLEQRCDRIFNIISHQSYYPCRTTLAVLQKARESKTQSKATHFFALNHNIPKTKSSIDFSALIKDLAEYKNIRNNEWSFHFNFLGIVSALYFIQDLLLGTDHFNSKSREVKLTAATKLQNLMNPTPSLIEPFTESEKQALQEGRLGSIVKKHGGLMQLMRDAEQQVKDNPGLDI